MKLIRPSRIYLTTERVVQQVALRQSWAQDSDLGRMIITVRRDGAWAFGLYFYLEYCLTPYKMNRKRVTNQAR